uniref:non-specific serine/threonine protein kinase n=1 Tax=Electrophorus electricus TaxID=8005 RepID=A0AAY5F4S8_ELEEL
HTHTPHKVESITKLRQRFSLYSVAIKVIDKKKARQDSYVLKNMKREPRIQQLIVHPNVVRLLETLETEHCYYMALELCAGGDLMERICERKRLHEREHVYSLCVL